MTEAWEQAQAHEKDWWRKTLERWGANRQEGTQEDYLNACVNYAASRLIVILRMHERYQEIQSRGLVVVELGSGPVPLSAAWKGPRRRIAVDPLLDYFGGYTGYGHGSDMNGVELVCAQAETYAYPEAPDIIFISNALDHMSNPAAALRSALNAMRPSGIMLLDIVAREPALNPKHPHGWSTPEAFCAWLYGLPDMPMFNIIYAQKAQKSIFVKLVK